MEFGYYFFYIAVFFLVIALIEKPLPFRQKRFFYYLKHEFTIFVNSVVKYGLKKDKWPMSAQNFFGMIKVVVAYLLLMIFIDDIEEISFKAIDYLFFMIFAFYFYFVWSFCLVIRSEGLSGLGE